jgi:hypothetical protein
MPLMSAIRAFIEDRGRLVRATNLDLLEVRRLAGVACLAGDRGLWCVFPRLWTSEHIVHLLLRKWHIFRHFLLHFEYVRACFACEEHSGG